MTLLGLPLLDIIIITVCFAVMIETGFWSMRRIKNQEDFFLGGRRFGKLIQLFANFGQATSSDTGQSSHSYISSSAWGHSINKNEPN